jgi:hypothetical protein
VISNGVVSDQLLTVDCVASLSVGAPGPTFASAGWLVVTGVCIMTIYIGYYCHGSHVKSCMAMLVTICMIIKRLQ